MMKSPTSLIRFRNAVGVMLALSAVFAVVISTISLTSDDASAQTPTHHRSEACCSGGGTHLSRLNE